VCVSGCPLTYVPGYAAFYENCRAEVDFAPLRMGFHFDHEQINGVGRNHRLLGPVLLLRDLLPDEPPTRVVEQHPGPLLDHH
jgi:hypothetical protein